VFGTFFHGESRAHDPNIHSHAVLVNLGLRQDGTTGALWTMDIFPRQDGGGERYRQALAKELTEKLHLGLLPERVGFHVRGVPKDLCVVFSQRSRALRKVMKERGAQRRGRRQNGHSSDAPGEGAPAGERISLPAAAKSRGALAGDRKKRGNWWSTVPRKILHGIAANAPAPVRGRPGQLQTAARESPEQDRPHTAAQAAPPEPPASQRPASTTEESTGTPDQRRSHDSQAEAEDTTHQEPKDHTQAERQRTKSKGISQEEKRDQNHSGRTQATAEGKTRQNTKDHTHAERQRAKSKGISQEEEA